MNAKHCLCFIALAAAAVASRGEEVTVAGRIYPGPCSTTSGDNCYIDVKVDLKGATCEVNLVDAGQEIVGVKFANFMLWRITSPPKGWIFTNDGVTIHDNWQREFTNPKLTPDAMGYVWKNRKTLRKTYKYTVTVTNAAPEPIECTLDPWIKNQ